MGSVSCCRLRPRGKSIPDHSIGPYRTRDILEALLAQIGELDRDLAANLIVSGSRYADASGLGNALKPCRNIDAVTKNIVALDQDVAEVDPDPEQHTPVLRDTSLRSAIAACTATAHSTASTTEGNSINKPSPVVLTIRPPCFATSASVDGAVFAEDASGADLVEPHQPRITGDVGGQYRRQPAFDPV